MAVTDSFVAIAGWTDYSSDFATNRTVWGTPGLQDAFVVVMDPTLSTLLGTFIVATPDSDQFWTVTFDDYAHLYAGGFTRDGVNIPGNPTPYTYGTVGGRDAFVAIFSIAGTPTSDEELDDRTVEPLGGMIWGTGQTTAETLFVGGGVGSTGPLGNRDAFFIMFNGTFSTVSAHVLGTAFDEYGRRVIADSSWSRLYFAGYTQDAAAFASACPTCSIHGPAPSSSVGASFVVQTYPILTPTGGALLTGNGDNGHGP